MWLYYNSFIAESDTKEKKAEVLNRWKQTVACYDLEKQGQGMLK